MMLELKGVSAGYGGVNVIHAVDVAVDQGEIVTLVGNNGAGKSTLVKTISGLIRARSGTISFARPPHRGLANRRADAARHCTRPRRSSDFFGLHHRG